MMLTPPRSVCSSGSKRSSTSSKRSNNSLKGGLRIKHRRRHCHLARIKTDPSIPLLRGKIHLALVYACPIWIYGLFQECRSQKALTVAFVCVLCAFINFGSSALLHNVRWKAARTRVLWRRVDHVGIFLMIAGSCSPIPALLFSSKICLVWVIFNIVTLSFGLCACLFTDAFSVSGSYSLRATCYVFVGLANVLFLPEFHRVLTNSEEVLFILMAVTYILGAGAYAMKWPNPWASVVGYHEVFHILCLTSAVMTFKLNQSVIKRTGLNLQVNEPYFF